MSSGTTRAFYGAFFTSASYYGGGAPPMVDGLTTYGGDFISALSTIKAANARTFWKFVDGPPFYTGVNSEFSLAMWKSRMDLAAAKTSAQQMGNFVADGTLLANYMLDDLQPGSSVYPGGTPSGTDLDEMARYSKSLWSLVPTMFRANNTYLKGVAPGGSYKTVDFCVCQIDSYPGQGPAQTFYQNNLNDGRACGLGTCFGINLLDGGSGLTAPWNQHPDRTTKFGMSPQEIRACGDAFSALTYAIGITIWAHKSPRLGTADYYNDPQINAAITDVANQAIGKLQGPINWHSQPVSSASTIAGSWSLIGTAIQNRTGNVGSLSLTAPSGITLGCLSGILVYSRDSARIPTQPSGWSTANSISGSSLRGGSLALYYKISTGGETSQTVTFSGAGESTGAIQGKWFCFSGNTSLVAGLLNKAGSAKSWSAGSSSMGPVPGITPTSAGCMVMVCVAKANDFGAGDSVPDGTISATTKDGETWNRCFAVNNLSNDDQGYFLDYAFLSDAQSITTKSWSQLTQANSNSSAAGCGFMVAFAPAVIQLGTPPAITRLEDVALSVGSTLSFTATSTGSTPITFSKTSGPSTITMGSGGTFLWTPDAAGTYVIVLQATNSFGSSADEFNAVIGAAAGGPSSNNTPVIVNPGDMTVRAQERTSFAVVATDADGDPITFSLDASAPRGSFIDQTTGQVVWTPTGEQGPGTYPFVVLASDGQFTSRSTFTVTVQDVPWTRVGGPSTQFGRTNPAGNSFRRI